MKQQKKKKIKESIPFTIAPKTTICLGINLTKEIKYPYTENYKTLMKDIKDDRKKWKTSHVHVLEGELLKCLYYLKQSIHLMQSVSKY